jgi:HEAT repeat protein
MVALSEIGDEGATGTAAACLASKSWPMRRAAISLLSKFPNEAVAAASGLLASTMVQQQRTGVQLIAALPEEDAVKRLGHLLDSPSQGVQLEALLALNGRVPENLRSKVADLQGSRDPYLKLAALGISMDR